MKEIEQNKFTKEYRNPYQRKLNRGITHWIAFALGLYKDQQKYAKVPDGFEYPQKQAPLDKDEPQVTWVNHSTFLVEHQNLRMLTDPIWSNRCSPVSFVGPKRKHEAGIDLDKLPEINVVLISHNHFDHLDKASVVYLHKKYPDIFWMVPKGVKKWFSRLGILKVAEFKWGESLKILDFDLKITGVPSQHFSGRSLTDNNKTLWLGYVVEFLKIDKKMYFVGDTGYNPVQFKEIGEAFNNKMDLSLIPIGTYSPKKFMETVHISPQESVHIHREVGSKLSVGCHFKTFTLSQEAKDQPPFDLYCCMEEAELDHNTFRVLQPGETINW